MVDRYKVWVDVGGTFTDCFVVAPDDAAGQTGKILRGKNILRGKVLSSGLTKATIGPGSAPSTLIDLSFQHLPDDFWVGAKVKLAGHAFRASSNASVVPQKLVPQATTQQITTLQTTVTGFSAARGQFELAAPLLNFPRDYSQFEGIMFELDAGIEAPVLAVRQLLGIPLAEPLPPLDVRLGTTRGTNALLTRTGAHVALVTTLGFRDVLRIGTQERPELFSLNIIKPQPLTEHVVELDERLSSDGSVLIPINANEVHQQLRDIYKSGIRSLAICLLHSFHNDVHERVVAEIAQEIGFENISVSSQVAPLVKLVSRAETTTLDAYLNPILGNYISNVWQQFGGPDNTRLRLMTSGGQLVSGRAFRGCDSVLSGPAGGVVALAATGEALRTSSELNNSARVDSHGVIGFDMGGTSTDVSRYEGALVKQLESRKAGVRVMTPMMAIHTVAAGGGSICHVDGGRLLVGPQSAGSNPGPACYGSDGPLTVTDLNLILGRLVQHHFPFQLDRSAAVNRLNELRSMLRLSNIEFPSVENLAEGFLQIAVAHMAEAVRTVTTAEGSDPRHMSLVSFGGAAGQHACAVAESLGMSKVVDHPDASMFSALGMGLAAIGRHASKGLYVAANEVSRQELPRIIWELQSETKHALEGDIPDDACPSFLTTVELRFKGTESTLAIELPNDVSTSGADSVEYLVEQFRSQHRKSFGYDRPERVVELVTIRVEAEFRSHRRIEISCPVEKTPLRTEHQQRVFLQGEWRQVDLYDRESLSMGNRIAGPAVIAGPHNAMLLLTGWQADVCQDGTLLVDRVLVDQKKQTHNAGSDTNEAVELEVTARRLEGIAEQMGEVLRRTSVSVNVKQRLDYSCAIFNQDGYLIAGAMHVPVHLGAMGHTVRSIMTKYPSMQAGDCYLSNNPYAGGSHLPDVTAVAPVFVSGTSRRPDFYVANRAHHAEIGGITPGSMPPSAKVLEEEGVVIDNFALIAEGRSFESELESLLRNARYPSRNTAENLADIAAQVAAARRGADDLRKLAELQGTNILQQRMNQLLGMSAQALDDVICMLGDSPQCFSDTLVEGYEICVSLQRIADRLVVDFQGTSAVHPGGWNATPAIVSAALLYVLRCLTDRPLPLSEGVLQKIDLKIPECLLNPARKNPIGASPAVVAGNVETSQRIVDCLFGALGVVAASQGTMNNLLIGDSTFGYYETICGGAGATLQFDGADAVHTHMTNTRITDPEIMEVHYPLRLWRFEIRAGSGGAGKRRGGDGVIRELEILRPLTVSMLSSRRGRSTPYGIQGGEAGKPGENILIRDGQQHQQACDFTLRLKLGDRIRIETPGGGGAGAG